MKMNDCKSDLVNRKILVSIETHIFRDNEAREKNQNSITLFNQYIHIVEINMRTRSSLTVVSI